jgi:2-succinyl-5-enolpyruvyl-6-hydroxy-3-cyclohexene-1-carboxylate synthase
VYCNKENVNILTALLVAHGVRHAVVCPGSRNAPIVHNLNECPSITCYPVTDERSAGFFALGIAQATDQPVVVCVTSGTALLNVAPAVAEAHYQHQSLIVISADRPAEWIDQLDGQTLRQPGALEPWVSKTVNLPEIKTYSLPHREQSGEGFFCNRLVNEALIEATADHHPCVHINVPISEPLFDFSVEQLPDERVIHRYSPATDYDCLPQPLLDDFLQARRPLIVFGQLSPRRFHYEGIDNLFSHVIVLHEALAPLTSVSHFDEALTSDSSPLTSILPDFILYVGDAVVSKRLKHFLREATNARCWRVSLTGEVEDTFQNLRGVVVGDAESVLQSLNNKLAKYKCSPASEQADYRRQWLHLLKEAKEQIDAEQLPWGEAAAVRLFEEQLQQVTYPYEVHYANSTPIRLANRYAQGHPVWCNRGVNGIEGSLSTAAGFSTVQGLIFCVLGDLSFFYDQNALWNQNIGGNLRILLLNNGHGAIFDTLTGLSMSPVSHSFVAGQHTTTAEGICQQNDIYYQQATNEEELQQGMALLLKEEWARPMLLEVICRT